jgi:DMSO reductase anchor subunit
MNIVEFIKFVLPEYQILHAIRLYGLISLRDKTTTLPEQQQTIYYDQAVIIPTPSKQKGNGNTFLHFISFVLLMGFPLYFITTSPFRLIEKIETVYRTGYAIIGVGYTVLGFALFLLLFGISLVTTPLRRMYYRLPWLLPFIIMFALSTLLFTIALPIMNRGYYTLQSNDAANYFLLMSGQLVFCRLLLCIGLYQKPVTHIGGEV